MLEACSIHGRANDSARLLEDGLLVRQLAFLTTARVCLGFINDRSHQIRKGCCILVDQDYYKHHLSGRLYRLLDVGGIQHCSPAQGHVHAMQITWTELSFHRIPIGKSSRL
jgi:hypothetical protein